MVCTSTLQSITEENQGRNLEPGTEAEAEGMEEQFISRLADHNLFILITYTIQDNGLIGGNAQKELRPSTSIICYENAPKALPTNNLIGTYFWLMFPFPYNSNIS